MTAPAVNSALDVASLGDLKQRAARNDPKAVAEAAVQFEALFIGLMLKTARDASLGQGILDGADTQQYLELMDQQVALELARNGGFGFGKLIEEQLGGDPAARTPTPAVSFALPAGTQTPWLDVAHARRASRTDVQALPAATQSGDGPSADAAARAENFVTRFRDEAAAAANALGIDPKLLLAQAALETGWGAALPRHGDGRSTNNLFGIKAGGAWQGERAAHWTIEHSGGVAERKREDFRAYGSSADSFADYVNLIASTPRYAEALKQAHDAEGFARAVTAAGYATDPDYAEKWLAIYRGERLGGAVGELKPAANEPTQ
jgi:flagellar protein FlgJ